jgi:APA family basic amino acid/polyamine antiporter
MLGAGVFINTFTLASRAGALGSLMYIAVGILMLPLILSIAKLLRIHPAGGFYVFAAKEMHPFAGFLSGFSYFTAKLASCMLMIHVSTTLLQNIFPVLSSISSYVLDVGIVGLFTTLNLLNIRTGSTIQKLFIGFKAFPILFAILTGLFLLQGEHFSQENLGLGELDSTIPLVVFAIVGFEAACSISSKIRNAHKNASLAVLISFAIVILIETLFQTIFYGALGQKLALCTSHCEIFPALIQKFQTHPFFANQLTGILHLAIASSTLGAAYGVIFSNSWNLHILAENQHLFFSRFFTQFNRHAIPFACVIAEGLLCLTYLAVSQGALVPLQQIGALGCVIAYTLSVGSLLRASKSRLIPVLGLASCAILITACVRSFFLYGMSSLIAFSLLLLLGVCMFSITSKRKAVHEEL